MVIGLAYLGLTNGPEPALNSGKRHEAAARSRLRAGHNLHTERLRGLPFCNCATPRGPRPPVAGSALACPNFQRGATYAASCDLDGGPSVKTFLG